MNSTWAKWIEVENSESVKKICHRNNKLFVVFQKNPTEVFVYNNVSDALVRKMFKAKSLGGFINQFIKPNHNLSTKLKVKTVSVKKSVKSSTKRATA
jgi:hypothetical protein